MDKIKVVHIITSLGFGGAEKLLLDLVSNLNKSRYEVRVATVIGGGALVSDFASADVMVSIFNKKNKLGLGTIWQIYRYLRKEKPTIVHTHLFGGDTWGRLAAILARVPIIISTEHNTNLDEGRVKRLIKKFLSFFTRKVIAVSEAVKDYSVRVDHIKSKKIVVIPNGIDVNKFATADKAFGDPPVIGVIGRLEKQKGHEYLFEALNTLKTIPWVLWVVGDGKEKNKLERLAKDLGLRERIIFLGARRNIAEILSQIDIFVLPSLWEGLGLAVLEAAAAGKPIVASKVGGVPEIIKDGQTGLLVEPGNVKSLADGLERFLLGGAEARAMGARARTFVVSKYNLPTMVRAYEDLYESLLKRFKKG